MKKYIKLIILCCCYNNYAQTSNIFLAGDNYITTTDASFPSKTDWTNLSNDTYAAAEFPIETYWFVKANDAHIIIHLSNAASNIYIELSGKKTSYHFPADYSEGSDGSNDFLLGLTDNTGAVKALQFSNKNPLTVHVDELDALHVSISFDGTLQPFHSNQNAVVIKGKISLQKHDAALQKLPDEYNGCDNTIYNKWSPRSDLGQWRTATECEVNFHHKVWATFNAALAPAYEYLQSKKWTCNPVKENKITALYRDRENQLYTFKNCGQVFNTSFQSDPTELMHSIQTDKILELSEKIAALPYNPPPQDSARINKERAEMSEELNNFGKSINDDKQLTLEVVVNTALPTDPYYTLDVSNAVTKKTASGYIIKNIKWKGSNNYTSAGGTYIFYGNWQVPEQSGSDPIAAPVFNNDSKKLVIQSIYIRLGCGDELATQVIRHIDFTMLDKLLQMQP
jgi:hypothetical protein